MNRLTFTQVIYTILKDLEMRWKIETENNVHVVAATSSREAVRKVQKKDTSKVLSAKLMPKNTIDKLQSVWRRWIAK